MMAATPERRRKLLSRSTNLATRQRVYRIGDGLEIDEIDHFEVRRSRVFFDDIVLMTYHRFRGVWFMSTMGSFLAVSTLVAVLVGVQEPLAGWIMFGIMGAPFLLAILLRITFGMDEINVYGRRSQATMRFMFRKARARRLFDDLATATRLRQR